MAKPAILSYVEQNKPYTCSVYFDGPSGKRQRRKFVTRKEARGFLTDKEVEYENLGRTIASHVTDDLKRDAHSAKVLLEEFGVSLADAAVHYRKHLLSTSKSAPISSLVREFLAQKKLNGRTQNHLRDLKGRLNRFCEKFGSKYAAEVSSEEIEDWLLNMPGLTNLTRNHYRAKVHSFFAWCVRRRRCIANPVTAIEKAKEFPTACSIYSIAEMRTLLAAASVWRPERIKVSGRRGRNCVKFEHHTDDILANLILCGFAGLRQSEFQRLTWDMVKLDRGKIDLPAEITKTKRRKLVTIQPVLATWLRKYFPACRGPVMQKKNFSNRFKAFKRHLRHEFGLPWKHNALRHSFASYLLEHTQNPGHVAMELGHRGEVGVLWDHYAERVSKEDATNYWTLMPEAIISAAGSPVINFLESVG